MSVGPDRREVWGTRLKVQTQSNIEATNDLICRSIVGNTPESLWPKLLFVTEDIIDGLAFDINLFVVFDGEDVNRWTPLPVLVTDVRRVVLELPNPPFRMIPTRTVPIDQQRIAGLHLFEVPSVTFPIPLFRISTDAPDMCTVGKAIGFVISVTEINRLNEGLLETVFVDGDKPKLSHKPINSTYRLQLLGSSSSE